MWEDYQVLGPLAGVTRVLLGMEGCLLVFVGSRGCAVHSRFTLVAWGKDSFHLGVRPLPCIEIPVKNLVAGKYEMGPELDLLEQLANDISPKAVFLVPTDSVKMIGFDLRSVGEIISTRLRCPVVHLEVSGSAEAGPSPGYRAAFSALLEYAIQYRGWSHPRTNCSGTHCINLVGWMWPSRRRDHEVGACLSLLQSVGICVNRVLFGGASLDDFIASLDSHVNALICSTFFVPELEELEKAGGPQLVGRIPPYGFSGTREWLHEIATALGQDISTAVDAEVAKNEPVFQSLKSSLRGKRVFVGGGPGRLIGLLHVAADLELEIVCAALYWPKKEYVQELRHVMDVHGVRPNILLIRPGLTELRDVARDLRPDLWMGGYQEHHICRQFSIPYVPTTVSTAPHMTFEGAVNLARKLVMASDGYDFVSTSFTAIEPGHEACVRRRADGATDY